MEGLGLSDGAFVPVSACRSCGSTRLFDVLDLGVQPLANAFRAPDDERPEARYPLAVVGCAQCSLVQLSGSVDPHVMFDHYPYFSSFSTSFVDAARELARRTTAARGLTADDLVVEVGSNDGYLLRHYRDLAVRVLGVEPAANVAETARANDVDTVTEYFGDEVARALRDERGPASVVHANNVMAHVPDVHGFVAGISTLLGDDGVAYVESPYVLDLVDRVEFDTIYHEHVFYYSATAVTHLAAAHGLVVTGGEHLPVHGGSIRYELRKESASPSPGVEERLAAESNRRVASRRCYAALAERTAHIRSALPTVLGEHRARGDSVAAYGAAAKGTVLLNSCGIGTDLVEFVVDRNPHKQGMLMPGVGIPIVGVEALLERRPDMTLLLAWNLVDEVLEQQRAYVDAGGTFLVPVPEITVVT